MIKERKGIKAKGHTCMQVVLQVGNLVKKA